GSLHEKLSSIVVAPPPDGIMTPLGSLRKEPRFRVKDIQANWSLEDRNGGPRVVLASDNVPAVISVDFYT
ncbi:hypothetical protein PENTCL1PPCAC_170, partial [Pristionchus entomophagus]